MNTINIKSTFLLLFFLTTLLVAKDKISTDKFNQIEDNLLVGLSSENTGLKISCAYFLGEMKSNRAINHLLKILKSSDVEEERIIAALSLTKIKSEQSVFAVKQRIRFDDSKRVQRLCELFYNNYQVELESENDRGSDGDQVVDLNMNYNGIKLAQFAR